MGIGPVRRLFRPVSLSSHVASGSGPDQIAIWPGVTFGSYYGLREDSLRHLLVRRLAYANLPYVASLFRTETGGLAFFAAGQTLNAFASGSGSGSPTRTVRHTSPYASASAQRRYLRLLRPCKPQFGDVPASSIRMARRSRNKPHHGVPESSFYEYLVFLPSRLSISRSLSLFLDTGQQTYHHPYRHDSINLPLDGFGVHLLLIHIHVSLASSPEVGSLSILPLRLPSKEVPVFTSYGRP